MKKILALALFLSACATHETTSTGVQVATQSESEKIIDRYTDRVESYNGLYNTLQAAATLHNTPVTTALLDQNTRQFQWDSGKYAAEKLAIEEKLSRETEIFLSFFTPEKKHDDLNKSTSMWKIFLDVNGRRYEGKASKIKLQTIEVQGLYSYHTRFSTPYQLIFPVSVRLIENYPLKLTLTGPAGSAILNFSPVAAAQ